MKKYILFIIIILISIVSGCINNPDNNITATPLNSIVSPQPSETEDAVITEPPSSAIVEPLTLISSVVEGGITKITYNNNNIEVLNSGITLGQLSDYLNHGLEYLFDELGKDYYESVFDTSIYENYYYSNKGINLLYKYMDENVSAIECTPESITLLGINSSMGFDEIKNTLGMSDIMTINHGLPGVVSYELRYEINGIKIKFFSWDEMGKGSFNMNIVKDFDDPDEYIRISLKQIENLFKIKKSEFLKQYNSEFVFEDENGYKYEYNSIDFTFSGEKLVVIEFPANYEIEGAREGMEFSKIMEYLGENQIEKSKDDEVWYSITYTYDDFILMYLSEFNDGGCKPYIIRK